jgi:hypothetical protein
MDSKQELKEQPTAAAAMTMDPEQEKKPSKQEEVLRLRGGLAYSTFRD